jgi:hypothetical protein
MKKIERISEFLDDMDNIEADVNYLISQTTDLDCRNKLIKLAISHLQNLTDKMLESLGMGEEINYVGFREKP